MSFVEEQDEKQRSGLKSVMWVVGAILLFVLAKGIGFVVGRASVEQFREGYSESTADAEIDAGIEKVTSELRRQLPIKLDAITTMVGVAHIGKTVRYMLTIDGEMDPKLIQDTKAELVVNNRANVCKQNKDVPKLFEHGVVMIWQYTDRGGQQFEVQVDHC